MRLDIVRAWKDETYRQSLSKEQLDLLPAHPVGELELSDADLESVYGGSWWVGESKSVHSCTLIACEINLFTLSILSGLFGADNFICADTK